MKIQNLSTGFDGVGKVHTEVSTPATAPAVGRKDQPAEDQVSLSPGAQLASSAIGAAEQASEIRQDKVERAKALMAAGAVGSDPLRLADAIVDRIMENN